MVTDFFVFQKVFTWVFRKNLLSNPSRHSKQTAPVSAKLAVVAQPFFKVSFQTQLVRYLWKKGPLISFTATDMEMTWSRLLEMQVMFFRTYYSLGIWEIFHMEQSPLFTPLEWYQFRCKSYAWQMNIICYCSRSSCYFTRIKKASWVEKTGYNNATQKYK